MNTRALGLTALLLAPLAALHATEPPTTSSSPVTRLGAGEHTRTIPVGNMQRCYRVHVPKIYDAGHPTPVIAVFHGGGNP